MTALPSFPVSEPTRPLWLVTLADLALLLLGFMVLVQATQVDGRALAQGVRQGFGRSFAAAPTPARPDPMPVAAAGLSAFAPGSATLPAAPDALVAWAREAVRDARVTLRVTASVDGSAADVDPVTGSGAVLAADRARGVAAALAHAVPPGRVAIATATTPGRRAVIVTLAFAGVSR